MKKLIVLMVAAMSFSAIAQADVVYYGDGGFFAFLASLETLSTFAAISHNDKIEYVHNIQDDATAFLLPGGVESEMLSEAITNARANDKNNLVVAGDDLAVAQQIAGATEGN